ncbi:MAG: EAL domain-containing protein (putative c-di-GMP-specific phosphodiesterase class I) [Bermanella sp.]|jgi:EAL domain-containing protein (putative c-di-GMP-specific phosphodiesterase class I)/GGDEF domain-containing protein
MILNTTKTQFILIFWITALLSQDLLGFEISSARKSAIDNFWVISDQSGGFTRDNILNQKSDNWTQYTSENLNLGYTQASIWVKLKLTNSSSSDVIRILDITYPLLDLVTLYEVSVDNKLDQLMISGDSLDFNKRNMAHPNHIEIINLKANSEGTFIINIQSNSPIQTQFIIWDISEFQAHYRSLSGFNFIYLGLILSIVIFNFFVYLFIKEKVYLYYTIYASLFALLMASQNGILFEYVLPSFPSIHNWSQLLLAAGVISYTAIFNSSFLKIAEHSFGKKALSIFAIIPVAVVMISPLVGYALAIQLMVVCGLTTIPACFIIGIQYSKNRRDKSLYILAWSWLIVGVVCFLLLKLGVIPFNLITTNSIQIGSVMELITFSIAMARRIHTEKETRIQAQEIIIKSSRKTAELHQDLLYSSLHHPITGLPNFSAFEAWIEDGILQEHRLTVVYIRLSRISEIDKTLGRKFSEQAQKAFSERLNNTLKESGQFTAIKSNKKVFAATLNSTTHGFITAETDSDKVMASLKLLRNNLDTPLDISNMEIEPYLVMSYTDFTADINDAASLLRHARIALDYAVPGDQSIVKYSLEIDPYNERRFNMMAELSRAIHNDNLALYYQPLVDAHTKKIIGAEALIRWPHEEYGLIMPDQFIQTAEQTGVIQALSLWVLKNAITQQLTWAKSLPNFLLSINISAFNLQDKKFIEAVNVLFTEHQNLAKNIVLEITETQMMTDTQHALKNLWQLSELGFHIAIDDFGTGYSNLAYLKKLPATELKIDKTFILNLESDKQNQVLVQTAIHMAHNLGLKVVAEGVESEHARVILCDMGCDMCQGYHFSKAVPVALFDKLLKQEYF